MGTNAKATKWIYSTVNIVKGSVLWDRDGPNLVPKEITREVRAAQIHINSDRGACAKIRAFFVLRRLHFLFEFDWNPSEKRCRILQRFSEEFQPNSKSKMEGGSMINVRIFADRPLLLLKPIRAPQASQDLSSDIILYYIWPNSISWLAPFNTYL